MLRSAGATYNEALRQILILALASLGWWCAAQASEIADLLATGAQASAASQWDKAAEAFQRALDLAVQAGDAKSEAGALIGTASVEYGKANYDNAEKLARQGLAINERLNNEQGISDALQQIANVQYRRGDFQASKETVERALVIRRKLGDRAGIAMAHNNLGNASRQLGDKLQALDYLSFAEREFAELGNERRRAIALNNLGIGYGELGDYERGLEYSRQSLAIAEKLGDDSRLGNALNNIAVIETGRGNYRAALQAYQQAIAADRRIGARWAEAEATNNIGLVYKAQGNHDQAIALFHKALAMNRSVGDKSIDSDLHNNLAGEMMAIGRPEEAEREFRQCLEITVRTSYRLVESEAHRGYARLLFGWKRYSEADTEIQAAARIQREISDTPNLAGTIAEQAHMRLARGHADEALALARQAEQMLAGIGRPETLWQAQLIAAQALRRLHRDREAAQELEASIVTIESLRSRVTGPPTALPAYFVDKLEPYQERVAISVGAGRTAEALQLTERAKSRALDDILRAGRVDLSKALTVDERRAERNLENRLVALNLKIATQPEARVPREERDRLRREFDAFEGALYAAHPETAFARGAAPGLTAIQIEEVAAHAHALILDYLVTPAETYVFVIKPGMRPRVASLGIRQATLAKETAEFHRQLASHDLSYADAARELYRLLLGPVERDLAGQTSVIIIPDAQLWDIPFHALQPRPNHFLIEDAAVSYSPSIAVLRETMRVSASRVGSPPGRELLALGDPAGPERLPEAGRQVRALQALYGSHSSLVLTGDAATEEALKTEAGKYRVVHVASHAILDNANPMYSYALLAKSGTEDGIFEARELMTLNLKADLLVLSACDTARGHAPPGEGIDGMLWATFVAGVPTTVASLWRVESSSASDLMIGFHRSLLEARRSKTPFTKAMSLRKAALDLIAGSKYSHPFYWAGFVVVGSPI